MSTGNKTAIDMDTIRAVVRLIAEQFDPERVVLFGSYARGQANEHSDVDLLVEMRVTAEMDRRGNPVRRAIAERFVTLVDVVIRSPEAVQKYRDDPYSLVHQALKDGVVLYDKSAA